MAHISGEAIAKLLAAVTDKHLADDVQLGVIFDNGGHLPLYVDDGHTVLTIGDLREFTRAFAVWM